MSHVRRGHRSPVPVCVPCRTPAATISPVSTQRPKPVRAVMEVRCKQPREVLRSRLQEESAPPSRWKVTSLFHRMDSKNSSEVSSEKRFNAMRRKLFPSSGPCCKRRPCGSCDEGVGSWGSASWIEYTLMVSLTILLLTAAPVLAVLWVTYCRGGFVWRNEPEVHFNLHPVAMITGFVAFEGLALMLFRICRCCKRQTVKVVHATLHALTVPCVVLGLVAAWDYHALSKPPIQHFYSLHSLMGIFTVLLFAFQFIIGLSSFLIVPVESSVNFRQLFGPIHTALGLGTFILAIATCLTGLNHKANLILGKLYISGAEEGLLMNALGILLITVGLFVSYILERERFRTCHDTEEEEPEVKRCFKRRETAFCPPY